MNRGNEIELVHFLKRAEAHHFSVCPYCSAEKLAEDQTCNVCGRTITEVAQAQHKCPAEAVDHTSIIFKPSTQFFQKPIWQRLIAWGLILGILLTTILGLIDFWT